MEQKILPSVENSLSTDACASDKGKSSISTETIEAKASWRIQKGLPLRKTTTKNMIEQFQNKFYDRLTQFEKLKRKLTVARTKNHLCSTQNKKKNIPDGWIAEREWSEPTTTALKPVVRSIFENIRGKT